MPGFFIPLVSWIRVDPVTSLSSNGGLRAGAGRISVKLVSAGEEEWYIQK